ncbi:GntR family transcriptional regulator [Metabacillus malikii]|uniref:GntR family transcriptional regulator n=1 Tax=Metabacillus malikii TaxID=1504265 RepID=A0ABT9ZKD3_9BACI|nr:GntR family transcriptional regulator [Metabacillus malikii]MDQ0232739.1 GntR family transcriptional regulator [Metabacillus malikii]
MSVKTMLVDKLITEIQDGYYKPNDKLPSENELADRYHVPRMVVRKAYERLQELGYIFSKQGKGSFVQNQKLQIPLILTGDVSFSEKMRELNYDYRTVNLSCEVIEYDSAIYRSLRVDSNETVYKISRLRIIEDCPIAVHTSFLTQSVFPDISNEGDAITSIFQYYRSKGFTEFDSSRSQLSVILPNQEERDLLKCPSLVPLLQVESGCADKQSGTWLEHSRIIYRSDCFTYVI